MKIEKNPKNTRLHILQAADELILTEGVAHLTLEAVAKRAEVSKGGLLYHFATKEDLIKGLVQYLSDAFDAKVAWQLAQEEATAPGSWLRAYIKVSAEIDQGAVQYSSAILAALANNPQLLEPIRQCFSAYQHQAEQSGLDPALATIIRLAVDGLWLAEWFDLAPPTGALREQVVKKLIELSNEKE
jgi:AcrR family transcriptional regulator